MKEMNEEEEERRSEAIKYGDVFSVSGELACQPITPKDAATMESAERLILGDVPTGGVSSVMKSAAEINERRGFVRHDDTIDDVREGGAFIAETVIVGHRIITESIGEEEVLGKFAEPMEQKKGIEESTGYSAHHLKESGG